MAARISSKKDQMHIRLLWRAAVIVLLMVATLAFFSDRNITGKGVGVVGSQGDDLVEKQSTGSLNVFFDAVEEEIFNAENKSVSPESSSND